MARNWKYIREALYEFTQVGMYVRVVAIDPDSGIEVTIVGAKAATTAELKHIAGNKLDYVVGKEVEKLRANQAKERGIWA